MESRGAYSKRGWNCSEATTSYLSVIGSDAVIRDFLNFPFPSFWWVSHWFGKPNLHCSLSIAIYYWVTLSVVGRVMAPKDVPILIPVNMLVSLAERTCRCDEVKDLEMRRLSWLTWVNLGERQETRESESEMKGSVLLLWRWSEVGRRGMRQGMQATHRS